MYRKELTNNQENPAGTVRQVPLRLWPGVILLIIQWFLRFFLPVIAPRTTAFGILSSLLFGIAILVWWTFFSRAPKFERWGAIALIVPALTCTFFLLDKSIATANMGLMFIFFSIPGVCLALVMWALLARNLSTVTRRITLTFTIIIASGFWIFLRTDGMTGDVRHKLNWRWAKTPEDKLLTLKENDFESIPTDTMLSTIEAEWPGFRGKERDGIVHDLNIVADWSASPPVEMWRRPIGPGCSSFAVQGNLLYTQEQLGEYEMVSCYNLTNGRPVWKHKDKARFYDSHAGPGPRSTPALANGRVYTLGATGILNAFNAGSGKLLWTRNATKDATVKVPEWGICGSPLVSGNLVIVSLTGKLAAYDSSTGELVWIGNDGGSGYSSPHLLTICNVPQVLLMSEAGAVSLDLATGETLWDYPWPLPDRILQPAWIGNNELLINEEYKNVKRIRIIKDTTGWNISDLWTSSDIKMLYNDFVIHKGYAYGFDGPSMACIDMNNGKRKWRGARYRGFQILLEDQDMILVLSEKGELALVQADPHKFTEISKIQVLKGKTWNHPALAGNILIVRNAEEMAAFMLPVE